jgi:hypothetical protein
MWTTFSVFGLNQGKVMILAKDKDRAETFADFHVIQQSEGKPTSTLQRLKSLVSESYDVHFLCSVCGKKGSLYMFDCAKKEATKFLRSVVGLLQALQFILGLGGVPQANALHNHKTSWSRW